MHEPRERAFTRRRLPPPHQSVAREAFHVVHIFRALRIVASKVFSKQVTAAVIARLPHVLSIESSPFASVWIAFYSEVRSIAAWILILTLAVR